jgi:hypothetical protein
MTRLKGIHRGPMTVKLVCGGIIEGVITFAASDKLHGVGTSWDKNGRFFSHMPSPLDIAEIISKPPQRTMRELYDAGELEVGMKFVLQHYDTVWVTSKTTEGVWLFCCQPNVWYSFDFMNNPEAMILQGEDNNGRE